jgi:hypothetical protein
MMNLKGWLFSIAAVLTLVLLLEGVPGGTVRAESQGAPSGQGAAFATPTPGPDGRIIYIVQPGDDFWTIAAVAGISLEELYALNGIQPGDYAVPGMELVLGFAGPAPGTAPPGGQPTATPAPPTPMPEFNTGHICVFLYQDLNGNARLEEGEPPLAGGKISVVDATGTLVGEVTTDESPDFHCLEDLPVDDYNVSAAVPEGYNPTTGLNLPLRLVAGDTKYVQFGAQASAALRAPGGDEGASGRRVYGVLGVIMLLAAGALGYYAARYEHSRPSSLR